MTKLLNDDLKKLQALAFDRADWAGGILQCYHSVAGNLDDTNLQQMQGLYRWMFVPISLWPFNIQDVLEECLVVLGKRKRLNSRLQLLLDLLPEPPAETVCSAVAGHEQRVQTGTYENLVKTQAKFSQTDLATKADPELRRQWSRIKGTFNVQSFRDHKGVVRRTMSVERNLRPSFSVNLRRRGDVFQAVFDAFCLRWNLYGMQHDEPLLLKLAVNMTPYGTMIHIPAYWSFDPKRDIRWDEIARLHRVRVLGRQGVALAENLAQRMKDAAKLRQLDDQAKKLNLKGEKKHDFICANLGWVPTSSPKRISRLRTEFKNKRLK